MQSYDRSTELISIHALREEGDDYCIILPDIEDLFQSTPSARRATLISLMGLWAIKQFQSTPSARRATICGTGYRRP